ncbi:general secretion pathway protein F [Andreprevotia lacus DSM 23236]|jgi:general secretion pathway protein F|uniref:General secretion pathway protein F n=1 Tax=Andreprevotia lacus DSM 23236 TaxID=1121001 RepID=A0A1W1XYF4_9NEIS|nr:type II secretion system F family protein [Andreprevotia lacus]SMC28946.1 general secretion pathway protein F [Andreprevotia lacus DSM 23236]
MPEYSFRAAAADGRVETGQVNAESADDAMRQLEDRLLLVFELKEAGAQPVRRSRGKVGHADLVVLIRELSTLANAGISLAEALETLKDASRDTPLQVPLGRMLTAIHAGEGFSTALGKTGLALPEYVFAMVRAGEATSNLGLALNRAADQMEFDAKMRSQTREALVYPIILVSTGSIAILFIFSFVVPRFAGLLKGRIQNLPWISEVVLRTGMFFNAHFVEAIVALVALVVGIVAASRNDALRLRIIEGAARLPIIGEWINSGETARWTNGLAMLLQSRVAILGALELAAGSVRLRQTAARLEDVRTQVNRGRKLSQAIEHQQLLEPTSLSMVRVGEQSGELGPMLQHVAHYWSDKNQSLQRRVVSLIEPASILILGVVIGFVMVGVVLAMTSLTEVKF